MISQKYYYTFANQDISIKLEMKENRNIISQIQTLLKRTKLKLSLMYLLCVLSDKIINKNSFPSLYYFNLLRQNKILLFSLGALRGVMYN